MVRDTREALVSSAAELLDGGGPEAVTLREVSRLSGVSHMAPYKHFSDKESLLAAVATRELDRLGDVVDEAARRALSPGEVLRRVLHSYTGWALGHPLRFTLIFGSWSEPQEELGRAAARTRSALTDAVRRCQESGEIPEGDPERRTAMLLALVHGAVNLSLTGHVAARDGKGRAEPADIVDDMLDLLHTSVRAPRADGAHSAS